MGQTNAIRVQFDPAELITSSLNSARQTMAFTGYFEIGDDVSIVAKDANGCIISVLATGVGVLAIEDGIALTFDQLVDTTTALPAGAVGWYVIDDPIDDAQAAIDRLYRQAATDLFQLVEDVVDSVSSTPIAGQTTLYVDDVNLFRVGDGVVITSDQGVLSTTTILDIDINADEINNRSAIVINDDIDLTSNTNVRILSTDVTVKEVIDRIRENIDAIDQPIENEYVGTGDCDSVVFDANSLFLSGSSKLLMDGRRLRLGTAGTLANNSFGAGNAALSYYSLVLGTAGNQIDVQVSGGAGLTVAVTGSYQAGTLAVIANSSGGTATAAQIAAAINADAEAQRLVQVVYGGNGSGVVTPFGLTALSGGLNDGVGDYAEMPQVYNNLISQTGYKWLSLHIRPLESNRLSVPPSNTEELVLDYRRALTNA
jgi:hypothetical protein